MTFYPQPDVPLQVWANDDISPNVTNFTVSTFKFIMWLMKGIEVSKHVLAF